MSNDYFRFREFTVRQSRCAMKVGTDGCLLGAWAVGGATVLDVGTGTGLIALMMAQRYADAVVDAIDIEPEACAQAVENVEASPFAQRIRVSQADVRHWQGAYSAIVCNPPFFSDSLVSPDRQRSMARHTLTLSYRELAECSHSLLSDDGRLSVIVPYDSRSRFESEAIIAGFFKSREWTVRTTINKPPRRCLLEFVKHSSNTERGEIVVGSQQHQELLRQFLIT